MTATSTAAAEFDVPAFIFEGVLPLGTTRVDDDGSSPPPSCLDPIRPRTRSNQHGTTRFFVGRRLAGTQNYVATVARVARSHAHINLPTAALLGMHRVAERRLKVDRPTRTCGRLASLRHNIATDTYLPGVWGQELHVATRCVLTVPCRHGDVAPSPRAGALCVVRRPPRRDGNVAAGNCVAGSDTQGNVTSVPHRRITRPDGDIATIPGRSITGTNGKRATYTLVARVLGHYGNATTRGRRAVSRRQLERPARCGERFPTRQDDGTALVEIRLPRYIATFAPGLTTVDNDRTAVAAVVAATPSDELRSKSANDQDPASNRSSPAGLAGTDQDVTSVPRAAAPHGNSNVASCASVG